MSLASDHGHVLATDRHSLAEWAYSGNVPPSGAERVHMSLWWAKNTPPIMKPAGPQELIVTAILLPPDMQGLANAAGQKED